MQNMSIHSGANVCVLITLTVWWTICNAYSRHSFIYSCTYYIGKGSDKDRGATFYVSCDAFKIGVVSLFRCQKFWWSKDWGWHNQKSGKSLEAGSPVEFTHPVGILTSLGISYQLPSTGMKCGFCMRSQGTCCKTSLTTRLATAASWNQVFSFYFIFQILSMCFLRGYSIFVQIDMKMGIQGVAPDISSTK